MFTKTMFLKSEPDMLIQIVPLCYPHPRTTILHQIKEMLIREYPDLLCDSEHGIIVINTKAKVAVKP